MITIKECWMLNYIRSKLKTFGEHAAPNYLRQRRRGKASALLTSRRLAAMSSITPKRYVSSGEFLCSDGYGVPIIPRYRYGLKQIPAYLDQVELLKSLTERGLVSDIYSVRFKEMLGERTLECPISEFDSLIADATAGLGTDVVLHRNEYDATPIALFSFAEIKKRVASQKLIQKGLAEFVQSSVDISLPTRGRALEIGFTSGGFSLFALEEMGFEMVGVDNAYGKIMDMPVLHENIADKLKSSVEFVFGDICEAPPLESESFDLIVSTSVIEHIQDISSAFATMSRVLKPGGVMIHRYDPFFHSRGGHSWGTLDSPWGHLCVPSFDMERYYEEFRPHEATMASRWFQHALNSESTISSVQSAVVAAGFSLLAWQEEPINLSDWSDLSTSIVTRCFENYPQASLNDLTTREIVFCAQKN